MNGCFFISKFFTERKKERTKPVRNGTFSFCQQMKEKNDAATTNKQKKTKKWGTKRI